MDISRKEHIISEEALIIRHSGEIPEVAYHNSIYHLTEDPEGPGLELEEGDLVCLKQAVFERYQWIILRDLDPENRDRRIYRGLERCAANWQRLKLFCQREAVFDLNGFREQAAVALKRFLQAEYMDVKSGKRPRSSINCTFSTLKGLAVELGLGPGDIPKGIEVLCRG